MKNTTFATAIMGLLSLTLCADALAAKASDAYFVKVDRETTTEASQQQDPDKARAAGEAEATGMATGKRQHKPVILTKPVDKLAPEGAATAKKIPGLHKTGDITLKRGVSDSGQPQQQ